jgi:hypothetical protein
VYSSSKSRDQQWHTAHRNQPMPETGVNICVPQIPEGLSRASQETIQKLLLNNLLVENRISDYLLWYYTPMALSFSTHLQPRLTVFDCMDEPVRIQERTPGDEGSGG